MSIQKTITLTEKGAKAGPNFNIYYSVNTVTYTFLQLATLNTIGSSVVVTLPDNARTIKLVSLGNCSNEIIHTIPGQSLGDFNLLDFDKLDFN